MPTIKVATEEDAKKFNEEAPKYKVVIAGFFMEKCQHCIDFKPEWEKFSNDQTDKNVLVAEVDSRQHGNINFNTTELDGFPTVLLHKKGDDSVEKFTDQRKKEALEKFLKNALQQKPISGGRKKRNRKTSKRRKSKKQRKQKIRTKRHRRRKKKQTKKRKARKRRYKH